MLVVPFKERNELEGVYLGQFEKEIEFVRQTEYGQKAFNERLAQVSANKDRA